MINASRWTGESAEERSERLSIIRAKAERWQRFKEQEGLDEAFDEMEAAIYRAIKSTKPKDCEGRELAYQRLRVLEDMRRVFDLVIAGGKKARTEIERLESGKRSFF